MEPYEEDEELDKIIEDRLKQKEEKAKEEQSRDLQPVESNNMGVAETQIEMPNFIPQIDKSKELSEQASDVVQIMGAQKASTDQEFMEDVSKNFQKGVLTEQETKNMKKQRLLEQEYFLKWKDVLNFVFIKSPHGLLFMKIMTFIGMIVYVPTRLIGMIIKAVGMVGEFINEIFNSVFGGKGKYLRDSNGNPVLDPVTKKPYIEKQGYNLFAKMLFGIVIAGLALALIFLFVELFTGFSVFGWFREIL